MTKLPFRTTESTNFKVYTGAVHFTCSTIVSLDIKSTNHQTKNAVFLVIGNSDWKQVWYVSKTKQVHDVFFRAPPGHLLGKKASVLFHTKIILMSHNMNWVLSQRCKQVTFR